MNNPLSGMSLDEWYKALIAVGLALLLVSVVAGIKPIILISLGTVTLGFGEWINHPERSGHLPRTAFDPGFIVTSTARKWNLGGAALDAVGLALAAFGTYRLIML
jgi:hypothetical protein